MPATIEPDEHAARLPRSLRALFYAATLAVALMGFAPQVGALVPTRGYSDGIAPGTDGTAHFQSPETNREADIQLLGLRPAGSSRVAVRLRMAASDPAWLPGCTVEVVLKDGASARQSGGCGAGRATGAPEHEIQSIVNIVLPQGRSASDVTRVRVMWAPPAYVDLPAV